jgi:hypothetical protein
MTPWERRNQDELLAWERRMQDVLLAAAEQFAKYADHHLAKDPPDHDKAAINVEWATRCRDAANEPDQVT